MTTTSNLSRRSVLKGGAGLFFAVGAGGVSAVSALAQANTGLAVNPWLSIASDGVIKIVFPSTEMGQSSYSTLPQILAEELDANWDDVVIEQLNADDRTFGNPLFGGVLYTAGSTGVQSYYDPMRRAGAQARDVLLQIAARELGVPKESLHTEPSAVVAEDGTQLSYGNLAAAGTTGVDIPSADSLALKDPQDFRIIGQDIPRRDVPAKSTGNAQYAIDVELDNMAHATVLRAPVEGETPLTLDDTDARAVNGVFDIVTLPDGVAVVAESLWAALGARSLLQVEWSTTSPARGFNSEATLEAYAAAAQDAQSEPAIWAERGDAPSAIANAERQISHLYLSDYAYHAQIEPMAAVASVDADGLGAEVWAGTQTQSWTTQTVMQTLGTTQDRVRLNMMTMGGSFGRRTAFVQEYVRDALLCSKAVGRPVKVTWTREDDVKNGTFRPAAAQHLEAGLTADGRLSGWHHKVATPSVIGFFNPGRWEAVKPNDVISMRGAESKFYTIPDFRADHIITERDARLAPYRGIGAAYTSFAAEAFMDELSEAAGRDPLDFRLDLVAENPRGRHLLEKVAEMSDWRNRGTRALGLSFAGYSSSMAAGVAEIEVDESSGDIRVKHVWAAVDAGRIVSPDNAHNQIEGGIIFGLSMALTEKIDIENGEVVQNNFWDYEITRADRVPPIDIYMAEVDAPPVGVGEVGTPMVSAAIANAFYAAKGRRLRHMPFTRERVNAAIQT
ncbi:xanthine dehydrogenase family protein molybdopterin-binding subunit (plasmid) [Roseobacter denitrificans]|uniref:Isoquinoline 1-oxidoreductase n=1 Tax=Roseobacter denitrificans (strain ATCC 33942 / OCh 114) TaxID=375451 RepID=Q07GL3_ROSDO|nr:molybdopterin cofactor-binding domain-containing protein [Roseobacter denitrificans]ABI93386.1 isoquinoline 1-oxidoreductase [Roseobacter denitrificans OCh 114]AVL51249.1 xanthine dehydrogenase family protein molybdopterin-binding subunit [Roseobacter denitrificans]SFG47556.1 isoquinoline 1-oxidoreductase, beta subunit [Roseobacter denitrificans OCh 114]